MESDENAKRDLSLAAIRVGCDWAGRLHVLKAGLKHRTKDADEFRAVELLYWMFDEQMWRPSAQIVQVLFYLLACVLKRGDEAYIIETFRRYWDKEKDTATRLKSVGRLRDKILEQVAAANTRGMSTEDYMTFVRTVAANVDEIEMRKLEKAQTATRSIQ